MLRVVEQVLLLFGVAGVVIGLYSIHQGNETARRGSQTATCVNNVLSTRTGPSAADAQAHINFAQGLGALLAAPKTQQATQYQLFLKTLDSYTETLVNDQKQRLAMPLGKC